MDPRLRGTGTSENHSLKLGSARFHDDLETTKDRSATMGHQFLLLLLLLLPFFLASSEPLLINHMIVSRFMLGKGALTTLGRARFKLFQTICLPTMLAQTARRDFVWVVVADPELDGALRRDLVKALAARSNFFFAEYDETTMARSKSILMSPLAVSSLNFLFLNSGQQKALDLFRRRLKEPGSILLNTGLDTDDGLHRKFVSTLQLSTRELFSQTPKLRWKYTCSSKYIG